MALGPVTPELGVCSPCLSETHSPQVTKAWWDHLLGSLQSIHSSRCLHPGLAEPPPPYAWMPAVACSPSGHGPHKLQSKLLKCNSNPDPVLLKTLQCLPFALGTRLTRLPLAFKASATWTLPASLSNLIYLFPQTFKGSECFSEENKGP